MLFQEFLIFPWSASLFILHSSQPAAASLYCGAAESIVRREPGYTHRLHSSLQFSTASRTSRHVSVAAVGMMRRSDLLRLPCMLLPLKRLISSFNHIGGPTRGHSSTNTMEAGGAVRRGCFHVRMWCCMSNTPPS